MSDKPIHANDHCRFYSYERGLGGGPRCAQGVDLERGSTRCCMPDQKEPCGMRQEYTNEERHAWMEYVVRGTQRLAEAIAAIPEPIKVGTQGRTTCPHCSGFLTWQRMSNGHVWLQCTGPDCIGPVHFTVPRDRPWPASAVKGA